MGIVVGVTKRCRHCSALQRELDALGFKYKVRSRVCRTTMCYRHFRIQGTISKAPFSRWVTR